MQNKRKVNIIYLKTLIIKRISIIKLIESKKINFITYNLHRNSHSYINTDMSSIKWKRRILSRWEVKRTKHHQGCSNVHLTCSYIMSKTLHHNKMCFILIRIVESEKSSIAVTLLPHYHLISIHKNMYNIHNKQCGAVDSSY